MIKLKNGNTVELVPDQEPPNPRTEWDNVTKIWCFHRRYILGDKHGLRADQFSGFGEFEQYIRDTEGPAIIKPLYMYDHSVEFAEPTPDTAHDKVRIEAIAARLVPRKLHRDIECCGGELLFTAYSDISAKIEQHLKKAGYAILEGGSTAEPGDPGDLL